MQDLKNRLKEDNEFRLKLVQCLLIIIILSFYLGFKDINLFIILLIINNLILSAGIIATYGCRKSMTIYTHLPIFLNYFLSFSFIIILPIDVAVTNHKRVLDRIDYQPQICIKIEYLQAIMFMIMINNNFIIRFAKIYLEQGHISTSKNIKATLKICAKMFAIIIILTGLLLIVLMVWGQNQSNVYQNMIATLQVIGNVYGIFVLTVLLGYSLIKFPYSLWTKVNYKQNLIQLILKLPSVYEQYQNERMDYQNQVLHFNSFINKIPEYGTDVSMHRNILIQQLEYHLSTLNIDIKYLNSLKQVDIDDPIDLDSMAQIRSKMNCLNHRYYCKQVQFEDSYNQILQISNLKQIGEQVKQNKPNEQERLIIKIDCQQVSLVKTILYKMSGAICFMLSLVILYSEIVLIFENNSVLVLALIEKLIVGDKTGFKCFQVIIFICIPVSYMMFCVYYATTNIQFNQVQKFQPGRTCGRNMMVQSALLSSLTFGLSYNLLMIFGEIRQSDKYQTQFVKFYNPVIKIPLIGQYYNMIVPLFISIFCILFLFTKFRKLVNSFTKQSVSCAIDNLYNDSLYQKGEEILLQTFRSKDRQSNLHKIQQQVDQQQQVKQQQQQQLKDADTNRCWIEGPISFQGKLGYYKIDDKNIMIYRNSDMNAKLKSIAIETVSSIKPTSMDYYK